ncbi:hypothetical protein [Nocardia sp. NPDC052566]|uniref:hypothetical protein n=1 Tax=Nocardia sp. NPDC052566 TaxID=3364330 RepID=UPI0037CC7E90
MAGVISLRIARLRKGATRLDGLQDGSEDARKKLASDSDALGEPWGNDMYGKPFAKDYLPSRAALLDALSGLAKSFGDFGTEQRKVADYLHTIEHDRNARYFGQG